MTRTNLTLSDQHMDILENLFFKHFGEKPQSIEILPASGSDRRYYRLFHPEHTAIGTQNSHVAENNSYFYFTELFRKHGIRVPEVYRISPDRQFYIQEDLGHLSLYDYLRTEGKTESVKKAYIKAIDQLIRLQWVAGREADFHQCYSTSKFDEKAITHDLLYFKYYFADLHSIPYDRHMLSSEMEQLSRELGRTQPQTLMYRDFQARNILLRDGEPYFIDFQGAMQGPPQYDMASLLWQVKADLPVSWKEELFNNYIENMARIQKSRVEEIHFRKGYQQFVLLRLLQVLGAYGFRGLIQNKPHFISSIPGALRSLQRFLSDNPHLPAYPELRTFLERLCEERMLSRYPAAQEAGEPKLRVSVFSFSYKNGIPGDQSGHGGGFIFDCRGIKNPGRIEAFKTLSGMDIPVIRYLERETLMPPFLDHVMGMVSLTVEDYLSRSFEHLSIGFGCTGGQHRSVYAAEQTAEYLRNRYQIPVDVIHHNQNAWTGNPSGARSESKGDRENEAKSLKG